MKKILTKLMIISAAAIIFAGVSNYYSDNAKAVNLNVEISINDQKPWTETFNWDNFLPGHSKKINLTIKNIGTDPAKIWKKIENLTTEENGIVEPEGEWYDLNNIDRTVGKNDMDTAMIYDLKIGSNIIIDPGANKTLSEVKNVYIYLGELAPEASMTVEEEYFLKSDAENWLQSDKMVFDIEILALSLDAPAPINN